MIGIFKPAKEVARLPESKIASAYKIYRIRVFLMIFIGYAGYYLVRKNFAVASSLLSKNYDFSNTDIGFISAGMAITYGLSKFILGNLADRSNVKYFIGIGLLASAILSILMGFAKTVPVFLVLMILNGFVQAMGAPPCSIVIGKWFSQNERGLKMGVWNTSHNIGGGLIAPLGVFAASFALFGQANSSSIFFIPAFICILITIFVLWIGVDTPASVGLPPIEEYRNDYGDSAKVEETVDENKLTGKEIIFKYVLNNKYVWYLCLANVFVYLIRQGIVNWIPIYLQQEKGFSLATAGHAMAIFEFIAIPGSILLGWISDVVFKGRRAPLSIMCMVGVIIATIAYWQTNNYIVTMIAVGCIGCFIYGPQLLIGMSLIDVVPNFAVGTAVGFSGLCGYLIGETLADIVLGVISDNFGWNGAFIFIIIGAIFALILLTLTLNIKKDKKEA